MFNEVGIKNDKYRKFFKDSTGHAVRDFAMLNSTKWYHIE